MLEISFPAALPSFLGLASLPLFAADSPLNGFPSLYDICSRDIKEEKMGNILRYIERQLGREVHLERDGMGRWAIPQELVKSSRIPFDQ